MIFKQITTADLQPKHSTGESADNKVRKAWSLQMPDEVTQKFAHFPGKVKLQLYKTFDQDVNKIWIDLLAKANKEAEEAGAQRVSVSGCFRRLEDKFCVNPDELLIQAAQQFIIDFAKTN